MSNKRIASLLILTVTIILTGCTGSESSPQTGLNSPSEPAVANETTSSRKTYSSAQHKFSLGYPASWTLKKQDGVVISANDQNDAWGGTNLNLQFDYAGDDFGMGLKELKKTEYINPQGIAFSLAFFGPDPSFDEEFGEVSDLNNVVVFIKTEAIPGLKAFSYNKKINPNGEKQLMGILATVAKI